MGGVKEEIPESVRQTKEITLQSLKQELSEKLDEKRRKKISKQYRMIKFFGKGTLVNSLTASFPTVPPPTSCLQNI